MRFDPVKAGVFSYWFIRWTNGCSRRWQFDTRPASSFFSSSSSSSSSFNCHIHPPRLVTITSQKPIQHHLSNLPSSTSWLRRCRSRSQSLPISNQLARSKCIDLLIIFWTGNWNQIPRGGRERGGGSDVAYSLNYRGTYRDMKRRKLLFELSFPQMFIMHWIMNWYWFIE